MSSGGSGGGGGKKSSTKSTSEADDRSAQIAARLRNIYKKAVLPLEKKYRYDYFYESPLLTDVEFDCE